MVKYCKSSKSLVGKTTIVTGANAGLGYQTALEFAKRGGRVILACRNPGRATAAREKIVAATGNENVVVKIIDMSSFDSVRDFAKDINETEERLDILVNNAGAIQKSKTTADGLQLPMQVNHFSPFLLTLLLLDLLKESTPSRIVNVSSVGASLAYGFDADKLNEFTGQIQMYFKTKLCNIFFTQQLAARLEGSGVTVYSLHPGAVSTEFAANMPILNWFAEKFFLTSEEGAQTQIYCSLEDGIEVHSGRHFENCTPVSTYCTARDEKKAKRVWEVSENAVGILQVTIVEDIFGFTLLIYLWISIVLTSMCFYDSTRSDRSIDYIKNLFYVGSFVISLFFMYFLPAQFLSNEIGRLSHSLYCTNWYNQLPATKKAFHIILMRSQQDTFLIAGGIVPINFETYITVINTYYTIYTFLTTVREQ